MVSKSSMYFKNQLKFKYSPRFFESLRRKLDIFSYCLNLLKKSQARSNFYTNITFPFLQHFKLNCTNTTVARCMQPHLLLILPPSELVLCIKFTTTLNISAINIKHIELFPPLTTTNIVNVCIYNNNNIMTLQRQVLVYKTSTKKIK